MDFPTESWYLLKILTRSWKLLLLSRSCQDSYRDIREVKITIKSKFSAVWQIVELGPVYSSFGPISIDNRLQLTILQFFNF